MPDKNVRWIVLGLLIVAAAIVVAAVLITHHHSAPAHTNPFSGF